jgi:hypothetical protein
MEEAMEEMNTMEEMEETGEMEGMDSMGEAIEELSGGRIQVS